MDSFGGFLTWKLPKYADGKNGYAADKTSTDISVCSVEMLLKLFLVKSCVTLFATHLHKTSRKSEY